MRYVLVTAAAVMAALSAFLAARHYARPIATRPEPAARVLGATESKDPPADQAAAAGSDVRRLELVREMEKLKESLKERPHDVTVHLKLASTQLFLGRAGEARTTFRRAQELEPASIPALYGVAACSEMLGDYREALKSYLEIRKLRPDDPGLDQRIRAVQASLQNAPKHP